MVDLLGFVGTYAAGKDVAAEYLVSKGWNHVSSGDMLREYARQLGLGLDRVGLQKLGRHLRQQHGPAFLVALACEKPRPLIVSGLRNIAEAAYIAGAGGVVVAFDAPIKLRFRRIKDRGRPDDPSTFEEFVAMQSVETSSDPFAQNIPAVMGLAYHKIWNPFSLPDGLHGEVDRLLAKLGSP